MQTDTTKVRKIIHLDMDCFFAAVEMRDNPSLMHKPVAVGGHAINRGVLSTCNYLARQHGLHSAMPTYRALKLCPNLVLVPVNMEKYHSISQQFGKILFQFTNKIEFLSIDEAFLDVTESSFCQGSATLLAQEIKNRVKKDLLLSISAGISVNKFLAKVASNWHKPDGLVTISPKKIANFVEQLPIEKVYGIGEKTAKKMHFYGIKCCGDLQKYSLYELRNRFGKSGEIFYDLCRGIDNRPVKESSKRQSISVEETFPQDIAKLEELKPELERLMIRLNKRMEDNKIAINKLFVKIKFHDFQQTTVEASHPQPDQSFFFRLLQIAWQRHQPPVRLIGIGVRLAE